MYGKFKAKCKYDRHKIVEIYTDNVQFGDKGMMVFLAGHLTFIHLYGITKSSTQYHSLGNTYFTHYYNCKKL